MSSSPGLPQRRWRPTESLLDTICDGTLHRHRDQENASTKPSEVTADEGGPTMNRLMRGLSRKDLYITVKHQDGFPVVSISPALAQLIQYNQNLSNGQSFLKMLKENDVSAFTEALKTIPNGEDSLDFVEKTFYCRLRKYNSQSPSHSYSHSSSVSHWPFRAICRFHPTAGGGATSTSPTNGGATSTALNGGATNGLHTFVIIFQPLNSVYVYPDQMIKGLKCSVDYSSSFSVIGCDDQLTVMLGYLPQDVVGTAGEMLIHPNSQAMMRDSLNRVLRSGAQKSSNGLDEKPLVEVTAEYQMRAYNGSYVTMRTELAGIRDTHQGEPVVRATHHVIKGPSLVNVCHQVPYDPDKARRQEHHEMLASVAKANPLDLEMDLKSEKFVQPKCDYDRTSRIKSLMRDSLMLSTQLILEPQEMQMLYDELSQAHMMEKFLNSLNDETNFSPKSKDLAVDLTVPLTIDIPVSVARQNSEQSSIKAQVSDVGQQDALELSQIERSELDDHARAHSDYQPVQLSERVLQQHCLAQTSLYVNRVLARKQNVCSQHLNQLWKKDKVRWGQNEDNPFGPPGLNSSHLPLGYESCHIQPRPPHDQPSFPSPCLTQPSFPKPLGSITSRSQLKEHVSSMLLLASKPAMGRISHHHRHTQDIRTESSQRKGGKLLLWNNIMKDLHKPKQNNHITNSWQNTRNLPYSAKKNLQTSARDEMCTRHQKMRLKTQPARGEGEKVPWTLVPVTNSSVGEPHTATMRTEAGTEESVNRDDEPTHNKEDEKTKKMESSSGTISSIDLLLDSESSEQSRPQNEAMPSEQSRVGECTLHSVPMEMMMPEEQPTATIDPVTSMTYCLTPREKREVLREDRLAMGAAKQHWLVLDQIEELLNTDDKTLHYDFSKMSGEGCVTHGASQGTDSSMSDETLFQPVRNLTHIPMMHRAEALRHGRASVVQKMCHSVYADSPLSRLYTVRLYSQYSDSPLSRLYTVRLYSQYSDSEGYISSIKESDDRSSSPVKTTTNSGSLSIDGAKARDASCVSGQSSLITDGDGETADQYTPLGGAKTTDLPVHLLSCVSQSSYKMSSGLGTSIAAESHYGSFSSVSEHRRALARSPEKDS